MSNMEIDESTLPLFLGVSRRAAWRGHEWDLLGVAKLILFPFFPQRLTGLQCVLGLNHNLLVASSTSAYRLLLTDESQPTNQAWTDLTWSVVTEEVKGTLAIPQKGFAVPATPPEGGETIFGLGFPGTQEEPGAFELLPTPVPPLMIWRPCRVLVEVEVSGKRYRRGEFICAFRPPAPLTDEERRAIASRPGAPKAVILHMGCKTCGSEANYYSQLNPLDPSPKDLPSGAVPLHEAPNSWKCSCGNNAVDLSFLRQGFHEMFRHGSPRTSEKLLMQFTPLYEAGRIQDIIAEYEQLIEAAVDEEPVQKYLEEHPLFWSFLSPAKILHKPAVLTKKKADFGILTTQHILYLVEIEKPTTRLTNQDGAISAEIQRGANQIRDWQLVVGDHRLALLAELSLKDSEVQEIRYLLIGGLARRATAEGLTKLRRSPLAPNTDFCCFDELASFLHTLAGELRRL